MRACSVDLDKPAHQSRQIISKPSLKIWSRMAAMDDQSTDRGLSRRVIQRAGDPCWGSRPVAKK